MGVELKFLLEILFSCVSYIDKFARLRNSFLSERGKRLQIILSIDVEINQEFHESNSNIIIPISLEIFRMENRTNFISNFNR